MYEAYKPLRNFMREFPLIDSLILVWIYFEHVQNDRPLPPELRFRDAYGRTLNLKGMLFAWDLEIITRELVLNAGAIGRRSLARWSDLAAAVNHLRRIDGVITEMNGPENVMMEVHRIIHRQFPWQRKTTQGTVVKYVKIYGSEAIGPIVERETGLTMLQLVRLGAAIGGSFLKNCGMSTDQDYGVIGITPEKRDAFLARLVTDLPTLRRRTKEAQSYSNDWLYTWNPLFATPLIQIDPEHPDRVICPLSTLIVDQVLRGTFYDLIEADGFREAYGGAFQRYVGELLATILQEPQFWIIAEKEYYDGKNLKHGIDWIVSDRTANMFIECKAKRLTHRSKSQIDEDALVADLDVLSAAIVQTYKNIRDAREGKTRWVPNGLPTFPIIVTLEDWYLFSPRTTNLLEERVALRLDAAGLSRAILEEMPYIIASIEELEVASRVMTETGAFDLLSAKVQSEHRYWMLLPFIAGRFGDQMRRTGGGAFGKEFASIVQPDADWLARQGA